MFRILIVVAILATPYILDDALHATGVKRVLWIMGGLAVFCCAVIFVIDVVRLLRSKKIDDRRSRGPQPANDVSAPFGADLANAVADSLDKGNTLAHGHAYYCGMGLAKYEENYIYASVQEGEVNTPKYGKYFYDDVERGEGKIFGSRAEFVAWLSAQTNSSLHGDGNQRITYERLKSFALIGERRRDR